MAQGRAGTARHGCPRRTQHTPGTRPTGRTTHDETHRRAHAPYRQASCPEGTSSRRCGPSAAGRLQGRGSATRTRVTHAHALHMHTRHAHTHAHHALTPRLRDRPCVNTTPVRAVGGTPGGVGGTGRTRTIHAVVHLGAGAEHLGLGHDRGSGEERAELRRQLSAHGNDGEQLHTRTPARPPARTHPQESAAPPHRPSATHRACPHALPPPVHSQPCSRLCPFVELLRGVPEDRLSL